MFFQSLLYDLFLLLPLYFSNAALLFYHRSGLFSAILKFDKLVNRKFFGANKTYGGLFLIFFMNLLGYFIIFNSFLPGFLAAFGMCVFTLLNSFIKRRIGLKEGAPLPLLDQLDFFIGGVLGLTLSGVVIRYILELAFFTLFLHVVSNFVAYKLKIKDVWW